MAREFRVAIKAPDGDNENPAYTFASDLDTGMHRAGTNSVGIAAGGTTNLFVMATEVRVYNGFQVFNGDAMVQGDVSYRHMISGRSTSMMDLEVLSWM